MGSVIEVVSPAAQVNIRERESYLAGLLTHHKYEERDKLGTIFVVSQRQDYLL